MIALIYRLIALFIGLGFSQLLMEKYIGYLYINAHLELELNVVPIWAFVIPGLLGIAIATKGWHDQFRNYERSFPWFLIGILINMSSWVYMNSEPRFQVVVLVVPFFVWALIAHRKKFFNNEEERTAAAKSRVLPGFGK